MLRLPKFHALVGAVISRTSGGATASEIYHNLLDSGERALPTNIYVALEKLEDKGAVIRTVELRTTPDGKQRDVNVYRLTAAGRDAVNEAVERLTRSINALRGFAT